MAPFRHLEPYVLVARVSYQAVSRQALHTYVQGPGDVALQVAATKENKRGPPFPAIRCHGL